MALFARLMVVATALLGVAAVAPAQAAATLTGSATVIETPNDGVIGAGDHLAITVDVSSTDAINDVHSTLTSSTPNVTVTQGTSDYPDIPAGTNAPNKTPFLVDVGSALVCGTTLNFNLSVSSSAGTVDVPVTVATGRGQTDLTDYDGGPVSIGFRGTQLRPQLHLAAANYQGTAAVAAPGLVRSVQVKLGHLTHDNIRDLTIKLVDPTGRKVTLVDQRGAAGQDFTDTEFAATGAPFSDADQHHTGIFLPDEPLNAFTDVNQKGSWRLEISEPDPNEVGRLDGWTLRIATADCTPHSFADLRFQPADRVDPGTTVTLDGSHSVSANGPISQYDWDFGDGHFTPGTSTVTHLFSQHGNYAVRLQVHDAAGVIGPVTRHLIVSEPPTARISPVGTPRQSANVTLDGSTSSDFEDGANLAKYEWDLDYDGSNFTVDKAGAGPTVRFATPGLRTIALRVTDGDGATDIASEAFNVAPTFAPTVAVTATPNPVSVGALVSFDASGSTDDGTIVGYDWDLDGNGTYETTGTSPTAARSYPNAGVVSVGLRLTDDDGRSTVTHVTVLVRGAGGGGPAPGSPGATPGGRTPAGGGGAEGGAAGGPAAGALAASLAGSSIQKLKLITRKGLSLRCRADRAATCSVSATIPAAKARSLGLSKSRKKAFVLGRASVQLRKAGTATITVRVAKRALAKLRRISRVSVLVTGKAADSGGGHAVLRRVVLLRR